MDEETKHRDIELRLALLEAQVKEFQKAWQRMEGAMGLIKYASLVAGIGWAIVLWVKEHVRV